MSEYEGMDDATLQEKLGAATSYEERSAIRQAMRRLKKSRGEQVGRPAKKGVAGYNRFAASSAPRSAQTPKSYIAGAEETTKSTEPRSSSRTPSRGSTRSDHETPPITSPPPTTSQEDLPPRPDTPTPPPTPEYEKQDVTSPPPKSPSPPPPEPEQAEEKEEDEDEAVDSVPPHAEDVEVSPPPSPEREAEEEEEEEEEEPVRQPKEPTPEPVDEVDVEREEEEVEPLAAGKQEEEVEEEKEEAAPVMEEEPDKDEPDSVKSDEGALRSRQAPPPETRPKPKPKAADTSQAEFQGFKFRRTTRDQEAKGKVETKVGRKQGPATGSKFDFGVKLKPRESRSHPATTDVLPMKSEKREEPRERAQTYASPRQKPTSGGNAPRTLGDYQQLSSRSQAKAPSRSTEAEDEGSTVPASELQMYLVSYVNSELGLHPALPEKGKALFDSCSNPTLLCKLINKSVPGTVDMRALTKIPLNASPSERREGLEENMTLVTESARAIGCRVTDDTGEKILAKDPQTIKDFLVDLIRARVVHLPGMEDEPSTTFNNLATLFKRLGISVEGTDQGEEEEEEAEEEKAEEKEEEKPVTWKEADSERLRKTIESPPPAQETSTWREQPSSPPPKVDTEKPSVDDSLSSEERAARRKAEREKRMMDRETGDGGLSFEERAAQRRAEREKRMKERETTTSTGVDESLSFEERMAKRRAERERRRREREALATAK